MYVAVSSFKELVTDPMKQILLDGINRIMVDVNGIGSVVCVTEPLKLTPPTQQPNDLTVNERRSILWGLANIDDSSNAVNNPNTQTT